MILQLVDDLFARGCAIEFGHWPTWHGLSPGDCKGFGEDKEVRQRKKKESVEQQEKKSVRKAKKADLYTPHGFYVREGALRVPILSNACELSIYFIPEILHPRAVKSVTEPRPLPNEPRLALCWRRRLLYAEAKNL